MRREFEVHMLSEEGKERARRIAVQFDALLEDLEQTIGSPEGREMAIVRTKLEEACFFAKKAMASRPEHQQ